MDVDHRARRHRGPGHVLVPAAGAPVPGQHRQRAAVAAAPRAQQPGPARARRRDERHQVRRRQHRPTRRHLPDRHDGREPGDGAGVRGQHGLDGHQLVSPASCVCVCVCVCGANGLRQHSTRRLLLEDLEPGLGQPPPAQDARRRERRGGGANAQRDVEPGAAAQGRAGPGLLRRLCHDHLPDAKHLLQQIADSFLFFFFFFYGRGWASVLDRNSLSLLFFAGVWDLDHIYTYIFPCLLLLYSTTTEVE